MPAMNSFMKTFGIRIILVCLIYCGFIQSAVADHFSNPTGEFLFNMVVYGVVTIDGQLLQPEIDEIAIVDTQAMICGVSKIYSDSYSSSYYYVTIQGNALSGEGAVKDEDLSFIIWDDSEQREIPVTTSMTSIPIKFEPDTSHEITITATTTGLPIIEKIAPNRTIGIGMINISGANFYTGTTITIAGIPSESVYYSSTKLSVSVPMHEIGTLNVVLTNPNGQTAIVPNGLTYVELPCSCPVPDSGPTKCYDDTSEIPCPKPGEPFYGQAGNYTINEMSFTKMDNNGNDLPDDAEDWVMVRDNVTGLIWEIKQAKDGVADYENPNDADNQYTWYDTNPANNLGYTGANNDGKNTQAFIEQLNQKQLGGFNDWRMPSPKELGSIANMAKTNPAIDVNFLPTIPSDEFAFYWSSTSDADNTGLAWGVYFNYGNDNRNDKDSSYYVRAVRGGQCWSFDNLVINGDRTITDIASGMMWELETKNTKQTWKNAMDYCENASTAMYTDWRLPEQKEIRTIVNLTRYLPAMNIDFFHDTMSSFCWSSTSNARSTGSPWGVSFAYGYDYYNDKDSSYYVRAVRGGQSRSFGNLFIWSPKQASFWQPGNTMSIEWETQNIPGNVKISLSTEGGRSGTYETIAVTENDGAYDWQVTGDISVNCMLKIEPIDEPDKGTRQGLFTIHPYSNQKYQTVDLSPSTTTLSNQSAFLISANYSTSDNAKTNGIGVRFHYNSSLVSLTSLENVFLTPTTLNPTPTEDTNNFDNDVTTDQYVELSWTSLSADWPNESQPVKLADLQFIALSTGQTSINTSLYDVADGYTGKPIHATVIIEEKPGLLSHQCRFPVSDSGQTQCYGTNGNVIPCPNSGEAFYGQDATYTINQKSFTKLDATGNDLPDDNQQWFMVRDNITGLIWEIKTAKDGVMDYTNINDADNTYTWYQSNSEINGGDPGTYNNGNNTQDVIKNLNLNQWGGFNDWRLPTIRELESLVHLGMSHPALYTSFFPAAMSDFFWSLDTSKSSNADAWCVHFGEAYNDVISKSNAYYVRAVRGIQNKGFDRLIINGDGTITNTYTGLMWEAQIADAPQTWENALSYCEQLSLSHYNDWRLPNRQELRSIIDYQRVDPAMDASYFTNALSEYCWTSTTDILNPIKTWGVDFSNGSDTSLRKSDKYLIRAVRGGQLLLADHLLILQPSQASFWTIGESMPISWEPAGITGNVIISLSRDGGKEGTFETIAETQNNGTFNWQVTGDISVNCVMKIVPINAPDKGTQQGLFTIQTDSGYQFQNVILFPDAPTVSHTSSFTFTAIYSTSNHTQTKGIGVRFHYDSSMFQFTGYENVCLSPTINDPTPKFDTDNADNDPSTDLYVVLSWASLAQDWPAVALPVKLADLIFTAIDTGQGNVNVSFLDTSDDYTGKAGNSIITSTIATDLQIESITQRTDGSGFLNIVFIGTASQSITGSWLSDACIYSLAPDYSIYTPMILETNDPAHNANSGLTFSPEGKRYTAVVNASEWLSGNYKIQLAFTNEMAAMSEEISIDNTRPIIDRIAPNRTIGIGMINISGANFYTGTTVTIAGIPSEAVYYSSTKISVRVPMHEIGSVNVMLTNPNGQTAIVPNGLTYVELPCSCPIPDSGPTKCYDDQGEIPCPKPGEPFYGQAGNYTINEMSFTKMDNNGNDLPDDAEDWVMVRDNVTGLIWEVKQSKDGVLDYDNPNDADNQYSWYDTDPANNLGYTGYYQNGKNTQILIEQLNQNQLGGFNDWRMPSPKELASIVNLYSYNPAIDVTFFPDVNVDSFLTYWTSKSIANANYRAVAVNFYPGGIVDYLDDKANQYFVRAVRGRQPRASDNLIINDDRTITDIASGIMWEIETTNKTQTWKNAMDYCENSSFANYTDWRLPEQKEIRSIVDFLRSKPSSNIDFFHDTMSAFYWSSTSNASNTGGAWGVHFLYGYDGRNAKDLSYYVRAVRGGQCRLFDHLFIWSPKQASFWQPGNTMSIEWETQNIPGSVKISLSREGGRSGTYETIAETENDGYYEWIVTGDISVNCMLKIEPLNEPDKGTRQGLFSIYPYTPEKYQQIILRPTTTSMAQNMPITITANYSTSDNGKTYGIGIRFHYDSSLFDFTGFNDISLTPTLIEPTPKPDNDNFDNDLSTDSYVAIRWTSPIKDWPQNALALSLANLNFNTIGFGPGNINVSFLEVSDGYIGKSDNATIIVKQPENTQPIISLINDQTIDEDTTGFISFTVTDAESAPCDLTLNVTSSDQSILPDNSISYVCSENNYTITALPEMNQNGIVELSLMVSDHEGLTASTSVQLTITSVDDPPTITEISNHSIELNKACTLSFTITDADSTDLTVSATSSNLTLVAINNIILTGQGSVRSISITPTEHMSGSSIITLAVTDGNITITSAFELTVIPNYHPEIPTLSEPENNQKEVAQQPLLSWTCSDPNPGDILTYDVYLSTSDSLTTCIASGLTQTQLQLTHNLDLYQDYYWKVIVTDQYGATQSSPVWSFKTDDQPDIFFDQDLSPYTVNDCPRIDFPKSLAAQNNMLKNMIHVTMVDFENFNEGSINSLSLDFGKGGNATINLATGLIVIVENPNETLDGMFPVSGTKFLESKSTVNIVFEKEMSAFGFYVTDFEHNSTDVIFTHASGDKQTFQIPYTLQNSGSVSFWGIIFKAFTFQNITIKGSDDNDFLGFDDFIAIEKSQLSSENLPPEEPSQNTPDNHSDNIGLNPTLTWSCTDPNPLDTLTYTLYLSTSDSFTTPLTGNLSQMSYTVQSPLLSDTTYYWRVDATDPKGLTTQGPTWEFKTILVNTRPMISLITDQSMYEDTTSAISFTVTDAESDPCDLSIIIRSSDQDILSDIHISYSCDANNYTITASPEINQSGTIVLTVLVSDQYDLTASTSFPLTVLAVNDPPAISDIENQSIKLNSTTAFSYTITDVDSANFNVSATSSNLTLVSIENMVLNDSGMISITPTENMSGTSIITLAVSDGELTVTTDFELTVIPNYPPDTPSSPLPANDAYAISQYPQLSWQCSDQNPEDVLTFDVYLSQSQSLTETLATGLTQATFLITNPLSFHTRYYWRIDVTDQYGAKQTGQVWTFLTVPALNDGLSAYYPFDQDAKDHSGNGNHCSVHGPQPMMDHTMSTDSAYYFDGSNDYIQCPNTSAFSVGSAVSYIFWLKYQKNGFVYNKWSYGAEDKWIYGNLNFYFYQKSDAKPSEPVPVDTWLHVAIVYQSSRAYFYYNGEFISSSSMGSGSLKNSSGTPYFGSNPGRTVGSAGTAPYKGGLDEFRIYHRALSQEEIWTLYTENSGYVTVSSDTMHLTGNAGAFELTIDNTGQTPVNWAIISNASWMTIDSQTSGTNKGTVTVSYSAIDQQKRTGTLTILSDDAMNTPYTIVVNQQEDNVAPYTPSNLNPGDGAENQPVDLMLSWIGGDANVYDTTYYDLYLSLNDPPILYASDLTVTHYVVTDLLYEQDYFWKIVAKDTYDLQAQSPVYAFKTGARKIHMNVTLFPANSGIIQINGTDITVPYTQTFDPGTSISIAAIPSDSYSFIYWQGNIDQINTSYQIITAEHDLDITAIFNHPPDKPEITSISVDNVSVTITTDSFMDADASDSHLHTVIKFWREDQYIEDQYVINPIEIEMSASTSTLIPESNLQTGLKYRCQVGYQDTGSKMISWSDEASFITGNPKPQISQVPPGVDITEYKMVSFTQWPSKPCVTSLFAHLGVYEDDFRMGTYDPEIANYIEYSEELKIQPGRAYWILTKNGCDLALNDVSVSVDADINVALKFNPDNPDDGWNMIACPNDATYQWGDIQVLQYDDNGIIKVSPVSISKMRNIGLIEDGLWEWEHDENNPYTYHTWLNFELLPGEGYWVKALKPNVFLRFSKDSQNRKKRMAQTFEQQSAYSDKTPPMPMSDMGIIEIYESTPGGCFISNLLGKYRVLTPFYSLGLLFIIAIIYRTSRKYILLQNKHLIMLMCLLSGLVFCFFQPAGATDNFNAIVHATNVNIRLGPNLKAPIIGKIVEKGKKIEVINQKDNWYFIQYNFKKGWIYADFVTHLFKPEAIEPDRIDQIIQDAESQQNTSISGRAYFDLGVFAFEEGDYQNAITNFEKAIQLDSDNPEYLQYMGKAYLETKNYALSEKYLTDAWKMAPTLSDIHKDRATLYYRQSNYQSAATLFQNIIKKNPSDVMSTYYAAICLYKQNDYYQAGQLFQKAAKASPTLQANCLYYAGICNIKTGRPQKGHLLLTQVMNDPKAGKLAQFAHKWISALNRKQIKEKPYQLFAQLGYQYDSNIRLEPLDEDLYTDEDDFCTSILLSGNYNMLNSKPYQISAGMVYFNNLYNEYTQYNMSGNMVHLRTKLKLHPLTLTLNVSPSIFWLDSEQYLKRVAVSPSFSLNLNSHLTAILSFENKFDNNIENDDRDARQTDNDLTLQYVIPKKNLMLFSTMRLEILNADNNVNDYDRIISKAGMRIQKIWGFTFGLTGQYEQKKYKVTDSFYTTLREDYKSIGAFYVQRSILYQWLGFKTEFKFTKNSSNINIFNYERSAVTFSLSANH